MENAPKKPLSRFIWLLMAFPIVIPAIILAWVGLGYAYDSQKVKFWDPHEATVDSVWIEHSGQRMNSNAHEVYVSYSYLVEGQRYSCNVITYGYVGSNDSDHNKAIYKILKKAQTIEVYVNPNNSHEAVMVKGMNIYIFLFIAPLCVTVFIYYFSILRKKPIWMAIVLGSFFMFLILSSSTISSRIVVLKRKGVSFIKSGNHQIVVQYNVRVGSIYSSTEISKNNNGTIS